MSVEESVLSVLNKAKPDKLSLDEVKNKANEPSIMPSEKREVIQEALDSLFDKGKIQREWIEKIKDYVYWKTED